MQTTSIILLYPLNYMQLQSYLVYQLILQVKDSLNFKTIPFFALVQNQPTGRNTLHTQYIMMYKIKNGDISCYVKPHCAN